MFIVMDFDKTLKDFSIEPQRFALFKTLQKDLALLAGMQRKAERIGPWVKELRRRERLRGLFLDYLKELGITANPYEVTRIPKVSVETQIKTLLQHQDSFLNDSKQIQSQDTPTKALPTNYSSFKNPLVFKIKAVLSPESKLFKPETNNCTIKSIFFHNEHLAKSHSKKISEDLELKLLSFPSKSQLNGKITRLLKIDPNYLKSNQKLQSSLKSLDLLTQKPFFSQSSQLSLCQSSRNSRSRLIKSRNISEDSLEASTSRSSSTTNCRLGFFAV
jgi:hypothetical protein